MPWSLERRLIGRNLVAVCAIGLVLRVATPLYAQETRAAAIAAQQAEKEQNSKPYVPSKAEEILRRLEGALIELRGGPFPTFDSVYSGGGFTLGGGYRWYFGDRNSVAVRGMYSIKNYKLVDVTATAPGLAGGALTLSGTAGWRDATQIGYFGLGMETSNDDRANFGFEQPFAGVTALFRPVDSVFVLRGGLSYEDYGLKSGRGSDPSIETVYTPETAPGLGVSPAYLHTEVSGGLDWRTAPLYSRTGGYYGMAVHDFHNVDGSLTFTRVDAEAVQHLPVLRETWVVSLHARLQTLVRGEDTAPYFLLPSLGSGRTLRGYSSQRFRDRHSLLGMAEWRWIPNRLAMDMALFCDAGKVEARRQDLNLDNLATDCGAGVRFHGLRGTALRIEFARGSEGWNLVFAASPPF